jgi:hypothetical protein
LGFVLVSGLTTFAGNILKAGFNEEAGKSPDLNLEV